jgi:hypothetical protein
MGYERTILMLKNKTKIFALLITILMLALNVSLVFAARPLDIHIEVLEQLDFSFNEPFAASGPAVDNGLVCATGTVEDLGGTVKDLNGPYTLMWLKKRFYCDDASGTFDVRLIVHLNEDTGFTTANWNVIDGTGNYGNLKGNGKLVGTPVVLGFNILDVYDGKMH